MDVLDKLKLLMSDKNIKQAQLAKDLDINKSDISKFFSGKTIDFLSVFRVIKHVSGEDHLELMDQYVQALSTPVGIQNSLVYATHFYRDDLAVDILDRNSEHPKLKEWIKVYNLRIKYKKIDNDILLEECKLLYGTITCEELKIQINMIEAAIYYEKDSQVLLKMSMQLESKVNDLKDGFIKECFKVRLSGYLAPSFLYANEEIQKTIDYADEVINSVTSPSLMIGTAFHVKSHAYSLDNYQLSCEYLERAERLFEFEGLTNKAENLRVNDFAFISSINKQVIKLDDLQGEELAHQLIIRGELDEALRILDELDDQTEFSTLYLGMAKKDVSLMLKAHGMMARTGNNFFLRYFEDALTRILI